MGDDGKVTITLTRDQAERLEKLIRAEPEIERILEADRALRWLYRASLKIALWVSGIIAAIIAYRNLGGR